MEQQEMQEERRARNFVWAAAGHYGLEPLFLAYASDGTADMYLNMIIGLSYKWYDAEKLETFFHMLGGRQEELYQGMLWIGLEQALYEKEKYTVRCLSSFVRNTRRKTWQDIVS